MKASNHDNIVKNYKATKQKHLEKLATKIIKRDEKFSKLKEKKISNNVLNLF
jgi:hypothetical protein